MGEVPAWKQLPNTQQQHQCRGIRAAPGLPQLACEMSSFWPHGSALSYEHFQGSLCLAKVLCKHLLISLSRVTCPQAGKLPWPDRKLVVIFLLMLLPFPNFRLLSDRLEAAPFSCLMTVLG